MNLINASKKEIEVMAVVALGFAYKGARCFEGLGNIETISKENNEYLEIKNHLSSDRGASFLRTGG